MAGDQAAIRLDQRARARSVASSPPEDFNKGRDVLVWRILTELLKFGDSER